MNTRSMILVSLFGVTLVGCSGEGDDDKSPSSSNTTPTTPTAWHLSQIQYDEDGNGSIDNTYKYVSNSDGTLAQWQKYIASGALEYVGKFSYDASKRIVKEEWDSSLYEIVNGQNKKTVSVDGRIDSTVQYSYDSRGNRITYAVVNNLKPKFTRTETTKYTYDNVGRIIAINNTSYSYDSQGRLSKVISGDGDYAEYTYDQSGRVIKISGADYLRGNYSDTYTYSGANLTKIVESSEGITTTRNLNYSNNRLIQRDEEYKQVGETYVRKTSFKFSYDSNGNLIEEKGYGLGYDIGTLRSVKKYAWQSGPGYGSNITQTSAATDRCLAVSRPTTPEERLFDEQFRALLN